MKETVANFEIRSKDLASRIGKLETPHGEIETPTILPVINPDRMIVEPRKIQEIGAQALITNAYILKKNHLHQVVTEGLHNFLDFSGPIMTDSGAYQLMRYGEVQTNNEEILELQERINTDIGVILDTPTDSEDESEVNKAVEKTVKRLKESEEFVQDKETLYTGPLQGWRYPEIFKRCLEEQKDLDYDIHALGSIVPTMEQYNYSQLVEPLRLIKENLPEDRPIHLFGAGHPMLLPFLVAMGSDLFDSAAYSLYAQDGRYITPTGTKRIDNMHYLPCECPVCSSNTPGELEKGQLAEHNLHVTYKEMKKIKQAIREGTLFELLERKARAHPALKRLMDEITNDTRTIDSRDPIVKKHLFQLSNYSKKRSDYKRAIERSKSIPGESSKVENYGEVPDRILQCYPFSQTGTEAPESNSTDLEKVKGASLYWLGKDIIPEDVKIEKSRNTGRIRRIKHQGDLFAVVRSNDFMLLLHKAALNLHRETEYPEHRIVMNQEAEEFVKKGKSVFNKFVEDLDPKLKPGEPVIMVNEEDELLAAGETYLSSLEIKDFQRGEAAENRWSKAKD